MTRIIRVGVVEDDAVGTQRVLDHLRRYQDEHGVTFEVRTFRDGRDIVRGYRPDFDVIFLDIQMEHLNGLEAARRIRTVDADVALIFVTNMAQYAIKGYEVDALSYLVKPVPYFAFSQQLKRSIDRARRVDTDSIVLAASGGSLARVPLTDIVYIESIRHRIVVHTIDRVYAFTGTLKAFETDLSGKGFFRSNNCYLVNLRHVTAVNQSSCVLLGDVELAVSRPRRRAFLDALTDRVGGRLA